MASSECRSDCERYQHHVAFFPVDPSLILIRLPPTGKPFNTHLARKIIF
jgi:hypothetical protein